MSIYQETNEFLVECFHKLEAPIPPPVPTQLGSHIGLRYNIHRMEIAIIQKLARCISGLNASLLLLEAGYTQELGALFRTLDEFHEDKAFLPSRLWETLRSRKRIKNTSSIFFKKNLIIQIMLSFLPRNEI